jgi:hypothetical protein
MMKNILLMILFFTAYSMELSAQGDVSKARWIAKAMKVEGSDREWTKPLNFYDNATGLMFAIGNDKENIYLCFTVNEELRMKRLMSAGWNLEFTSNVKQKKFKAKLSFPAVNMLNVRKKENPLEKKPKGDEFVKSYLLQFTKITCKGFRSKVSEVALNSREHIRVGVGADSIQHVVFEIAIPLKELYVPDLLQLNELITMNVTVNALERPSSGGGPGGGMGGRSGGGMPGGMGGGRRGGGMPGGMSGGMGGGGMSGGMRGERSGVEYSQGAQGERINPFEKSSFKQKFTLSSN